MYTNYSWRFFCRSRHLPWIAKSERCKSAVMCCETYSNHLFLSLLVNKISIHGTFWFELSETTSCLWLYHKKIASNVSVCGFLAFSEETDGELDRLKTITKPCVWFYSLCRHIYHCICDSKWQVFRTVCSWSLRVWKSVIVVYGASSNAMKCFY